MMRTLLVALPLGLWLMGAAAAQSHRVDAVDPPREGRFPGSRGPDQLIIYTPAYGHPSTGTNPWGSEAIVEDSVVVETGVNDGRIPANGFVVSGHGTAAEWVNRHLHVGTPVAFDAHSVWFDDTPRGRLSALAADVRAAIRTLDMLGGHGDERQTAQELAQQIEALRGGAAEVEPSQIGDLAVRVGRLKETVWGLRLGAMASPAGEVRAVWHRIRDHSPEGLRTLAQELADAHINAFFPETIYDAQAISPGLEHIYQPRAEIGGRDALAEVIAECHARGIEVHAWVHCFFIGVPNPGSAPQRLFEAHPDWFARDRQGRIGAVDEQGYAYLNPAHPEVRRAMIDAYVALARDHDLDGLHLDYIRYPAWLRWEDMFDFSDFTRARVREELGFDPIEITPGGHPQEWSRWIAWRERQITTFVEEAAAAVRAVNPDIRVTAAVFSDLGQCILSKGQNWADWGREGVVDALMPMAYSADIAFVVGAVQEMRRFAWDHCGVVAGLGPFVGLSEERLIDQILAARDAGAMGQCLFSWQEVTPAMRRALREGPWRTPTAPVWEPGPR